MKNKCASCGRDFQNTERHYGFHGNFCKECLDKIEFSMENRSKRIYNRKK